MNEESRGDEQHERDGDLRDDQNFCRRKTVMERFGRGTRGAGFQDGRKINARGAQSGN